LAEPVTMDALVRLARVNADLIGEQKTATDTATVIARLIEGAMSSLRSGPLIRLTRTRPTSRPWSSKVNTCLVRTSTPRSPRLASITSGKLTHCASTSVMATT